ncbi:MAG: rubrerythrin family protein [Candidatus Lokiarchaeota archaeon]|nr:rubrerythrin family protein [Candidatus Lokiarchaeota archaeon]MCK4780036.1 rubrerythrin family protein [Candidatus Lokiarchaeota archaeon]
MSKTEENLKTAFAGESQANRKYLAFAEKAEKEGFQQVAKIFRAAAAAETVHAHNHLRVLGGIKSTKENIKAAVEGEHYEFTKMYPEFLEDAKNEGNKDAERSFHLANEVEKVHHKLYEVALEAVENGKDLEKKDVYICPVCGYTHEGEPPEVCPVCGAVKKVFKKIT